jgi:Fe-S-cluster formation regulator IscX/YfhJ
MSEVKPADEALVDELCEMVYTSMYSEYETHVLSYKERIEKIAAYREACEQAARDSVKIEMTRFLCPLADDEDPNEVPAERLVEAIVYEWIAGGGMTACRHLVATRWLPSLERRIDSDKAAKQMAERFAEDGDERDLGAVPPAKEKA